jgi:hypothetical protein
MQMSIASNATWARALALAAVWGVGFASAASAASSLSNALTGFTGNSTEAALQSAVGAAGFEFSSTAGLSEDLMSDPTIVFNSSGATFGSLLPADGGRNYMRTIESYAFDSFVAEVTATVQGIGTLNQVFFGLGSGEITNWGTPDFAGFPTVFMTPEPDALKANAADGITGDWMDPTGAPTNDWSVVPATGLVSGAAGTHRLRMTLDAATKKWTGSIDIDYAGGAFVADVSTPTYDMTNAYDDGGFVVNGWPTLPSKIYFGGDDGVIFKDFSVVVGGGPAGDADFNNDNIVDGADFLIWQRGVSGGTDNSTGDANGSGSVDGADLDIWKAGFGGAALAAATAIPEPSTSALVAVLLLCGATLRHKA